MTQAFRDSPRDVEARAYEIYRSRGGSPGADLDDWLKAEREVNDRTVDRPLRAGAGVAVLPPEDSRLVHSARVNLLLKGTEAMIDMVLSAIRSDLCAPVTSWRPGESLTLPPITQDGTIILHDIDSLTLEEQRCLSDWLQNSPCRTRIISTTTTAIMPLVEAGLFHDTLYYRLNTVYMEVAPDVAADLVREES